MKVAIVPAGTQGFDCNDTVSFSAARKLVAAGYRFAVRYAPRVKAHNYDLSPAEVQTILEAGLALMVVQHVEPAYGNGWTPTQAKGQRYGATAAAHASECGVSPETNVWLDLEDVDLSTSHETTIHYCNAWYDEVDKVGYTPGIYVGFNPGLTPAELYSRLKFQHYWGAYNLNVDQRPAKRGLQMQQRLEIWVPGIHYPIDPNVVAADKLGDLPFACAPDEWNTK